MNKAQKKPLQLQDSLAVRILICVLFPPVAGQIAACGVSDHHYIYFWFGLRLW